ncbi:MAG: RING finger protein [Pirellulaceae bacterium]
MECVLLLILFAVVSAVISGIGARIGPRGPARVYELLMRNFGGTYQGGGLLRRCHVRFRYGPTWVTVKPGSRRGRHRSMQVVIPWPDGRLDWQLESRATTEQSPPSLQGHEIPTGDADFDQRYFVSGRHVDEIRRLLSDGVRWQVNNVGQVPHPAPIRISIRQGWLIVEKLHNFKRPEELHAFTQQCLELFDQAMLTRSEGIEFVGGADEAQPVENPLCKICGEPIASDMVVCRRCHTPHHLDCWQYNGLCSTFGCRETRFQIPTVAQPRRDEDEDPSHGPQRPR